MDWMRQVSLSFTIYWGLIKLMSIELVMLFCIQLQKKKDMVTQKWKQIYLKKATEFTLLYVFQDIILQ